MSNSNQLLVEACESAPPGTHSRASLGLRGKHGEGLYLGKVSDGEIPNPPAPTALLPVTENVPVFPRIHKARVADTYKQLSVAYHIKEDRLPRNKLESNHNH